jgi:hypothetical protein
MIIDACTMFKCDHEFVAVEDGFLCHKCSLRRQELSVHTVSDKRLYFFPVPAQPAIRDSRIANVAEG